MATTKQFETGKTYILHEVRGSARFRAKVIRRTKCKVTFELSDTGVSWCETKTVTLTVRKDSNVWYDEDTKLEEVCGTATCDTNRLRKRTLFSLSAMEATVQM